MASTSLSSMSFNDISHTEDTSASSNTKRVAFFYLASVIPDEPPVASRNSPRRRSTMALSRAHRPRVITKKYSLPLSFPGITKGFGSNNQRYADDPDFYPNTPRRLNFKMPTVSTSPPVVAPASSSCNLRTCLKQSLSSDGSSSTADSKDDECLSKMCSDMKLAYSFPECAAATQTTTQDVCDNDHLQVKTTQVGELCPLVSERRRSSTTSATEDTFLSNNSSQIISSSPKEFVTVDENAICDDEGENSEEYQVVKECCDTCSAAHSMGLLPDSRYSEKWSRIAQIKRQKDLEEQARADEMARKRGAGDTNAEVNHLMNSVRGIDEAEGPVAMKRSLSQDRELTKEAEDVECSDTEVEDDGVVDVAAPQPQPAAGNDLKRNRSSTLSALTEEPVSNIPLSSRSEMSIGGDNNSDTNNTMNAAAATTTTTITTTTTTTTTYDDDEELPRIRRFHTESSALPSTKRQKWTSKLSQVRRGSTSDAVSSTNNSSSQEDPGDRRTTSFASIGGIALKTIGNANLGMNLSPSSNTMAYYGRF